MYMPYLQLFYLECHIVGSNVRTLVYDDMDPKKAELCIWGSLRRPAASPYPARFDICRMCRRLASHLSDGPRTACQRSWIQVGFHIIIIIRARVGPCGRRIGGRICSRFLCRKEARRHPKFWNGLFGSVVLSGSNSCRRLADFVYQPAFL